MNAETIAEFNLLAARFAEEKQISGNITLQLLALEREEQEINGPLMAAYLNHLDATPLLTQLRENFIQREEVTRAMRERLPQMESLCLQTADAIGRLIAANKK